MVLINIRAPTRTTRTTMTNAILEKFWGKVIMNQDLLNKYNHWNERYDSNLINPLISSPPLILTKENKNKHKVRCTEIKWNDTRWNEMKIKWKIKWHNETKHQRNNDMQNEMKNELKHEMKHEMKNEMKIEMKNETNNEMKNEK